MLSYQHAYHAGNLADVHKHGALAWVLDYLVSKDKPLCYIETHAGRGLYDLASSAAQKTGEAAKGVQRDGLLRAFAQAHPYVRAIATTRRDGTALYPGSPVIAASILRPMDTLHLAELHPQEVEHLRTAVGERARVYQQDGYALANRLCPPTPRRGVLLVDPSFETPREYREVPAFLTKMHRKWPVGVLVLWYPLLAQPAHTQMLGALTGAFPDGVRHEVRFAAAAKGHGLVGSGLFFVNPPYQLERELARLTEVFGTLENAG